MSESDSICFSAQDSKILLTFAEKGYLCDSLIKSYDDKISLLEQKSNKKDEALRIADEVIRSQNTHINKLEKKIWWCKAGLITQGGVIIYLILRL